MAANPLLSQVGQEIRSQRSRKGWSRRELASRAKLSERFLAQVELGQGNPSLLRLARISQALGTSPSALLTSAGRGATLALVGVRGAGKSSVGSRLAARRKLPFFELDHLVEEQAGLPLREIFEVHGEESYRRWEREALEAWLARGTGGVLATGGGIVTHSETFSMLARNATIIWLRARAEDHWERVTAQGDRRPMGNDPRAFASLRDLLADREPLYGEADLIVDTTGLSVSQVVGRIEERLRVRTAGPSGGAGGR